MLSITMKHGLVDQADKFKKRIASSDTSNYRIAYKNELVVGFPIDEGVLGFQTKYPAGIVSPAYDIWRLKNEADCHIPYLERYLRSSQARSLYASRMQGAVARRRSLTKADFLDLEIPFPPLADQIKIDHLLGKVEGLIAQRKQQLQQLDDLLKSLFLELFGDPMRNEKGWEKKTAIDYADCIVPGRDKPKTFSGGTPWVTTGDLQPLGVTERSRGGIGLSDEEIQEVRARVVPKSSVLLTCVGDLGVVSITGSDMVINQQIHAFQVSKVMSEEFFMYSLWFQQKYMYQNASQTTLPYMNKTVCNSTPMIRPPKDLQIQFSEAVKNVYRIKIPCQQSLADLETLHGALSQQAFKGELDLSRVPSPGIRAEEEGPVAVVPLHSATLQNLAVNLPESDNPFAAQESAEARVGLIAQWLEAYRGQLGRTPFLVQHFMAAVQTRLAEMHPDNDFALGANDYEHIKAWVFDALADGTLTQGFNAAGNHIELKAVQA